MIRFKKMSISEANKVFSDLLIKYNNYCALLINCDYNFRFDDLRDLLDLIDYIKCFKCMYFECFGIDLDINKLERRD